MTVEGKKSKSSFYCINGRERARSLEFQNFHDKPDKRAAEVFSMAALLASSTVLPSSIKFAIDSHPSFSASLPNPLFSSFPPKFPTPLTIIPFVDSSKWSNRVSFFPGFLSRSRDVQSLKQELYDAIAPLDRGAEATPEDQERVDLIARKLEALNSVKEPLKSGLLNGKWELLYTTSQSILLTQRPKFLRPNGKIYQAINLDTLRAQNLETWPFYNQATANLVPLNSRSVAVKFDYFKIASLIPIKSPGSGRGQIEITYLDEDLRITRGNRGNLFILKMVDPSYKVPL